MKGTELDYQARKVMSLKSRIGEFSVDLYYNDTLEDIKQAYTAKLHTSEYALGQLIIHSRANSFADAVENLNALLTRPEEIEKLIERICDERKILRIEITESVKS